VFTKPLSSNGLFRVAKGMYLTKRCLADGHIPAFRRHVTIYCLHFQGKFCQAGKLAGYVEVKGKETDQ
jgi:hypothetical protein